MAKPTHHRPPKSSGGANFASCVVATIFLIFVVIILLIVFFTLFKPKDPSVTVNAVQLPTFSISTNNTATFTFAQYITVRNPNRAVFTHYDSTMELLYAGNQVGFMFVPAGKIDAGRTEYLEARFNVNSFPVGGSGVAASAAAAAGDGRLGPTMEIESRMEMVGRVRVLHFFTHRVAARADCRVAIRVSDGSVLGLRC
uniref:Late embryogenesis abundant protein LEA-2 subgroup domain-containing protein n=1 Tax=Kalanchoe fedtschenkoi TaxID=63787 RepID=A0A7N0R9J8_KALFE